MREADTIRMTTQSLRLQAFARTAARLQQRIAAGGGMKLPDIAGLHDGISKNLCGNLGLNPENFRVPYRFLPSLNGESAFVAGSRSTYDVITREHCVYYNDDKLEPYFRDGRHDYPAGTDAPFSVPTGPVLLYNLANTITQALHWMCASEKIPRIITTREGAAKHSVQLGHFFKDGPARSFVEDIAELGALIYLRSSGHPVARNFAALHFTVRMIEAARSTGTDLDRVREEALDMMNYFVSDDKDRSIRDLALKCFEQYPDWIVPPKKSAMGILRVGELVFSNDTSMARLMRKDLGSELISLI